MAYFALGEFVRNKIDLNELFMKKSKNKIIRICKKQNRFE